MNKNKTVIISGASGGIGRSMVVLFAINRYNVILNYNRSLEKAQLLYRKLKSKGLSIELFQADVSKRVQVDAMVDYCINQFGKIDILINNSGVSQQKIFTDISEDEWDYMINVNLKGVFNCTQSVLKHMIREKSGKIINISSIWGMVGASCEVHYSSAKAGVIGFTKALSKELGPSNIQVNCIAPGIIETDMLSSFSLEELKQLKDETPLIRLGKPKDIARCALFLASKNADFFTGQILSPNGGFVI
ncbi:elongation factor P 5-aminopentanone reductase [Pseudobacteroides cellulosolvens]|uniref:Short-chain dehydrogenase/reductase SDR n=1 Tax=Pseudobacteroides cellulosolvens ATCC 35603 = DSM 2933 TaxID=398512 RepID=A0A0L6JXH1_9FIRM|nr:SDR family oxidoreductase [Pseudobacteroides cellulosolvens]KNY30142.1 short-chain dehydrogenase/reductase SDR [Pseudobacteroides cellulosolvens ATCC 35603 = DSM 2933]